MFDWDPERARLNLAKHGVSFEVATYAFYDVWAITTPDPDQSLDEYREITLGSVGDEFILMESHTDQDGVVRIISARHATGFERRRYEYNR